MRLVSIAVGLSLSLITLAPAAAYAETGRSPERIVDEAGITGQELAAAPAPGSHCTFARSADDETAAAELMAGRLNLFPHATVDLPADPGWAEDIGRDANWGFQYHTLRWADVLRREGLRTGDHAMLDRYEFLLKDWLVDNPLSESASTFAWYNMGVGVRAVVLVCAHESLGAPEWTPAALAQHGEALAEPAAYAGIGNHALHQDLGLLAVACATDAIEWRDLAVGRIGTLLERSIDAQGASDEGSIAYTYLNYQWYSGARSAIAACGVAPEGPFDRLALTPTMLAHATKPDGRYTGIGDSDPQHAAPAIPGTFAEYAATQGRSGPLPDATFARYDAGYVFSRSGWGTTRPAGSESHVSVRYGPPVPAVHGHQDAGSVTLFAGGGDLLWEQGRHAYMGGTYRSYVVRRAAHNVIDIPSTVYKSTYTAPLTAQQSVESHDLVTVQSRKLYGAVWTRTVLHAKAPGVLVVDDRVTQRVAREVVQRWHIGSDRKAHLSTARAATSGAGANATIMWASGAPAVSVADGQADPLMGWRSMRYGEIHQTPVVEARQTGTNVRFTTVVVPRAAGTSASGIAVRNVRTSPNAINFELHTGTTKYYVALTQTYAVVREIA